MHSGYLELGEVALLGFIATCSSILGAGLGLYFPFPGKVLAGILAFAAGSLIAALAIELGFKGAYDLTRHGVGMHTSWAIISVGFGAGAVIYYVASLFLEEKGAAIRYPSRFLEHARGRKRRSLDEMLSLLSKSELLRRLPAEDIECLLERVQLRDVKAGEVVFRTGDPGDALYIVARGAAEVLSEVDRTPIADLAVGQPFGEMALLDERTRNATVRAKIDSSLLRVAKEDFDRLLEENPFLERHMRRLSHDRAIANLGRGRNPALWARMARDNFERLSRSDENEFLHEAQQSKGAGLAIVFGNILDTIPGCMVIGAKFAGFGNLSVTLLLGMFLGGIPEAAASASMLRKANYTDRAIFLLWSTVIVAGILAALAGKLLISGSESLPATIAQAVAGGAILALVAHAMIPEALHKGGSAVVLPVVGGFLMALYMALIETT